MDPLIDKLCSELKPVKKLRHPCCCILTWAVIVFGLLGAMIWYLGLRYDLNDRLHDPVFLFEMLMALVMGISASLCAFWMRVPDMRGCCWMIPVPFTLLGAFTLWTLIRLMTGTVVMPELEFHHCMQEGLLMMAVPAVLMFIAVMQGCTTRPILMAAMNGLSIAALGYIALRLTCASESIGHILYTHLLPYIALGAVAGFLARKLYKW